MPYCNNCDSFMHSNQLHCNKCGSKVSYRLVCSCGKEYQRYDTFCDNCGLKLEFTDINKTIINNENSDNGVKDSNKIFKKGDGNFFTLGNILQLFFNNLSKGWLQLYDVSKLGFRDGYAFVLLSPLAVLWWILISILTILGTILYFALMLFSMIWAVVFEAPSDIINGRKDWS
jgi:hypothetical protein